MILLHWVLVTIGLLAQSYPISIHHLLWSQSKCLRCKYQYIKHVIVGCGNGQKADYLEICHLNPFH